MVNPNNFVLVETGYSKLNIEIPGFYLSKFLVTQGEWKAIMGNNPSKFKGDDNKPVETVSWDDAQAFIQKLNEKTGLNYRLPTEAEWEFAARGGIHTNGYEYAGSYNLDEVAWCGSNSGNRTQPVGLKLPNELGLYDMSGNVWEWCADLYGVTRVLRGGSWGNTPPIGRATLRHYFGPAFCGNDAGFRLAHDFTESFIPVPKTAKIVIKDKPGGKKIYTTHIDNVNLGDAVQNSVANGEHPGEDNPVPSLDKSIKKILRFVRKEIGPFVPHDPKQFILRDLEELLNKELQNGRETDKEQPKKKKNKRTGFQFNINNYFSKLYLTEEEAYEVVKAIKGGDELETDWDDVEFIEFKNGKEISSFGY